MTLLYAALDAMRLGSLHIAVKYRTFEILIDLNIITIIDDGRITTGDSEMIPILLQALQTHTNDSNVRKFSCGAIGNIVLNGIII